MKNRYWIVGILITIGLSTSVTLAESADEGEDGAELVTTAQEENESEAESGGVGGWIDLRPGWSWDSEVFQSENEVGLEYRFRRDRALGFTQEFRTNSALAGEESANTGLRLWDGYLWGEIGNVLRSSDSTITLGYEPRLYLPISAADRPAGLVLATRQYLKLEVKALPQLQFFLWEAPILAWYGEAGFEGSDEELVANRYFENRVELGARLSFFSDRLRVRLPVIVQSLRHANYDEEAANNDRWAHYVWIYPEVMVQVAESTSIGVDFYTDSLVDETLSRSRFDSGFRKSAVHFVFQQTL